MDGLMEGGRDRGREGGLVGGIDEFMDSLISFNNEFDCIVFSRPYPIYDPLCISEAPAVPVPWDCGGYIRCDLDPELGTKSRAYWVPCEGDMQYDVSSASCVSGSTRCMDPEGRLN